MLTRMQRFARAGLLVCTLGVAACAAPSARGSSVRPLVPLHSTPVALFVGPDPQAIERLREGVERGEARFVVHGRQMPYSWKQVESTWFLVLYDGENEPQTASGAEQDLRIRQLGHRTPPRHASRIRSAAP